MHSRNIQRLLVVSVVLLLAVGSAGIANAQHIGISQSTGYKVTQQSGTVIADLGFRPGDNGFGFANYGNDNKATNLTPTETRRLLGDDVCARINGDTCDLIPQVQQLMDQFNQMIGGGHCEGMAVLSDLFYTGQLKQSDFGQDKTVGLTLDNNDKLQREIAYWWSTQLLKKINAVAIKDKTPKELVDILAASMKDKSEYYVFHLYQPGFKNGHAITPYQIQDMGNGIIHVMVYDNNWPKDERFVEIDTNANTWTYLAATNPNVPEAVYKGDADSKTLWLLPISPRLKQQDCVFCKPAGSSFNVHGLAQAEPQYNEITLYSTSEVNNADLLITDAQGHRLGYQGGKFYSEIPGAVFDPVTSDNLFDDDPEPIYDIPVGVAFTVIVDGSAVQKEENASVSMVGPGYDLAVEDIKVQAGEKDTIDFSSDGTKISYTPSGDEAPDIIVGLQHAGPDYEFDIKGADVQPGDTVNVTLDFDKGRLGLNTTGSTEKTSTYGIQVDRLDTNAHDIFSTDGLTLDPNQTAYIEFGAWDGKGDMTVSLDKNNDGSADSTQTAPNKQK